MKKTRQKTEQAEKQAFKKRQIENFTRARTPEEYQEMKLRDLIEFNRRAVGTKR